MYICLFLILIFLLIIQKKYYESFTDNDTLNLLGLSESPRKENILKCIQNFSDIKNPLQKSTFINCMEKEGVSKNTLQEKIPALSDMPSPTSGDFDISMDLFSTMSQKNILNLTQSLEKFHDYDPFESNYAKIKEGFLF